jgi:hypothetical protein
MAQSGGSFFGIQAAARAPELYHGYVGVAQMVYQLESERLACEYMLERFKQAGDSRMVRQLAAVRVTMADGTPPGYLALRDQAMHRLGVGATHDMRSVLTGVCWPSLRSRHYTPRRENQAMARQALLWRERAVG